MCSQKADEILGSASVFFCWAVITIRIVCQHSPDFATPWKTILACIVAYRLNRSVSFIRNLYHSTSAVLATYGIEHAVFFLNTNVLGLNMYTILFKAYSWMISKYKLLSMIVCWHGHLVGLRLFIPFHLHRKKQKGELWKMERWSFKRLFLSLSPWFVTQLGAFLCSMSLIGFNSGDEEGGGGK